jgi:carbonic anhydrase
VGDVAIKHGEILAGIELEALRHARLCELNVIEQVVNVCQTTVVQDAWSRGQPLSVHGWIYGLLDGRIRELGFGVDAPDDLAPAYNAAIEAIRAGHTAP